MSDLCKEILVYAWLISIALAVWLSAGCGEQIEWPEGNIKYQIRGVVVYANSEQYPSRWLLSEATDVYLEQVGERFDLSDDELDDIFSGIGSISFYSEAMSGNNGPRLGYYRYKDSAVQVAYLYACIKLSAYWHELNHHYMRAIVSDPGASHKRDDWWHDLLSDTWDAWRLRVDEDCVIFSPETGD